MGNKTVYIKRILYFILALASIEQAYSWLHNKDHLFMEQKVEQDIVVFVHGTVNAPRTTGQLIHALRVDNQTTTYTKKTAAMRNDPFFYQSQPIGSLGLKYINIKKFKYGDAQSFFAHIYDLLNKKADIQARKTNYYTFGWTGQLNRPARMQAAKELLAALTNEVKIYNGSGINTRIHLIGYSHGGKVCINLAQITPKDTTLCIDELILLGTPIQRCSLNLIKHPMFKKIYNIYSQGDSVQTMDWFSTDATPTRTFIKSKQNPLPKKLNQIRIRMIEENIVMNKSKRIKIDPNHAQLWFFSWGHKENRSPLDPVPVAAFIPMIRNVAQNSPLTNLAIDITVKDGTLCFNQINPETLVQALMPNQLISKFIGAIRDCIPLNYYQEYQQKYYSRKA